MSGYCVLIPAAGAGRRFGADCPKQYYVLSGKTVLEHTVSRFLNLADVARIFLVVSAEDQWIDSIYSTQDLPEKLHLLRCGGATRARTVSNGLSTAMQLGWVKADDWVMVHDAARCCVPVSAVRRLMTQTAEHAVGGLLALPVTDTLKRADRQQEIAETVDRNHLWQAQTPQVFRADLLRRALSVADLDAVTDDASAIEMLGLSPLLVEGDRRNLKLTCAEDAGLAMFFLQQEQL